jgi:hypothetical protein
MSVTAQSIIRRVVETLNDTTSVRWPVAELVRYLNDGQREVGTYRPDALVSGATHSLAAGSRQTLPANGIKLLDIVRNDSTSQRAVRMTNRQILDAQIPNWHNLTGATEILHFIYDPRDPLVFYVYPPAAASGAAVYMIYAGTPAAITEPADGSTYSAVSGNIGVPDIYANALVDYVLYRAYTKDTEYAGNAARATAHYQAFTNALTVEANATAVASPKG